jgi:phthiocerol/phenolphthiocerol synthesis type-I polyketide synthase E
MHLLAERGRLMQSLPSGTMLAVVQSEQELAPFVPEGLSLAAVNSAKVCVVSGPAELTSAWKMTLKEKGIGYRELATSHAFHSAMMDPILATFEEIVRSVPRNRAQIPIISTLFGRLATPEELCEPAYWSGQLRQTVRFGAALDELLTRENLAMVEVGPGQILTALVRQHATKKPGQMAVYSLPRNKESSDSEAISSALGQLWAAGVNVDWAALHAPANRRRVPLPTYPFERKRYWVGKTVAKTADDDSAPECAVATNGNGSGIAGSVTPDAVEQLVVAQLQIMRQQINVMRQISRPVAQQEAAQQ